MLIGLVLMPVNACWVVQMEIVRYSANPTTISLFFNAIFTLVVLILINMAVARKAPRWALSQGELLVVYTMVALASALAGHDSALVLVPMLSWPFRMAEQTRSSQRQWFWLILLAGVVASLTAFWAMLHLMYRKGAAAKSGSFGAEAYNRLSSWLSNPIEPCKGAGAAVVVGFCIASLLQWMRVRYPWWPFHPLGFAVTASWEINLVWMPLFIAWLLKLLILRYGGPGGFRRSLPFFYGLVLGQFIVGSLWNIYGIAASVPTCQFWQ